MTSSARGRPVRFAAIGLDHAHVLGHISGLLGAGAELAGISSEDPGAATVAAVVERWPDAPWMDDSGQLLNDPTIDLVVTAAIPSRRGTIAVAAMRAGKDVVTDKPGCISLDELDEIRTDRRRNRSVLVGHASPSGSRCGPSPRPANWSAPAGSAGSSRPSASARTGKATAPTCRRRRPPGLVLRQGPRPAASSPTSPATRSTSSSGSPAPPSAEVVASTVGQLHPPEHAPDAGLR